MVTADALDLGGCSSIVCRASFLPESSRPPRSTASGARCPTRVSKTRGHVADSRCLFDIDGTLVDSNYLHVEAWSRGSESIGASVAGWRVHRSIGMDGDKLLESLLPGADQAIRKRANEQHSVFH